MPLTFSVVTPSYNQGQFIERTIQSVLAQSGVQLDYIVCDGGSTDNTLAILQQYSHRLRWISELDDGQSDAVNKGIRETKGDIIAWINSDDIYYPNAFKAVQHIFETMPHVQVIYGLANHIDVDDHTIGPYNTEPWDYSRLKEYCFICQPATFFRRHLVETYGSLDSNLQFCMDYELWLRYGTYTKFYYLNCLLAGSRFYPNTKTQSQKVAVHFETNEMLKKKFLCSPDKWIFTYALAVAEGQRKQTDKAHSKTTTNLDQVHTIFSEIFRGYARWQNIHSPFIRVGQMGISTVRFSWRLVRKKILPKITQSWRGTEVDKTALPYYTQKDLV